MTIIQTTKEQRDAATVAAEQNYWDKVRTPDRPGWTGGKCPVTEYFGKVAELGAAEYTGYGWKNLVLYSPDPADYSKPDMGNWDVKAGKSFGDHDIKKGVEYILWVRPETSTKVFYCKYDTCGKRIHARLTGEVVIRCWTSVEDLHLCDKNKWGNYVPSPAARRSLDTLPVFDWGQAA